MRKYEWEIGLTDLFDIEELRQLQNAFFKATGISSGISDANGIAITEHFSATSFCSKYIKKSPLGLKRCEECDKKGSRLALMSNRTAIYNCHAGLTDFASPIVVDGRIIGCFLGGQVLTKPLEEKQVLELAWELGGNPDEFLKAAQKIPILTPEKIQDYANFIYTISNMMSHSALDKYRLLQTSIEFEKSANMKSDFLANMSHEIRTPMNAVIGMAQMALRENLPTNARDYILQIISSGKTLLTIINDILDFSKIESGKMDISPIEYEPMSIINDVTNILMTRIGSKEIELILDISPHIPHKLYGDNIRIKQIIINLCNNAIKFTQKGQVTIRIDSIPTSDNEVEIRAFIEDTGIGIKKQDQRQLFQSFYQVNSKRNRSIEGSGLGLAISQQLLKLMGGKIGVESEYGKGSIFYFSFPQKVVETTPGIQLRKNRNKVISFIHNQHVKTQFGKDMERFQVDYIEIETEQELDTHTDNNIDFLFIEDFFFSKRVQHFVQEHPRITAILMVDFRSSTHYSIQNLMVVKKPLYSLNIATILNQEDLHLLTPNEGDEDFDFIAPKANILIIDDNVINLTVAEGLLKPLQMNIDTALSGAEAIKKITYKHYDILFMDHMMPEMDGIETTHIIRQFHTDYKNVPIIALTANAVEGTKELFLREGMNDFVPKPIELKLICAKLKKWLSKEKIQKCNVIPLQEIPLKKETQCSIEKLDVQYALKLLGSEELFFDVLKDYYQTIQAKSAQIQKLEKDEDWKNYTIEVHALKSSSRQIGATELSDLAKEMEDAGNHKNVDKIHRLTGKMLEKYMEYEKILAPYFAKSQSTNIQKPKMYPDLLSDCFSTLHIALENLDIDQMDQVMEEMSTYQYEETQNSYFLQLQEAIQSLDVDSCTEIVKNWESLFV